MAEGGQLPWKCQTIDYSRGPVGDYSRLHTPLPPPPEGYVWEKIDKEWTLTERKKIQKAPINSTERKEDYDTSNNSNGSSSTSAEDRIVKNKPKNRMILSKLAEPANKIASTAVENVDYIRHTVLPTDTIQGLCLRYKISATKLRQVNKFSGTNLLLAPAHLIIPLEDKNLDDLVVQDKTSPDYKLQALLAEFPKLRQSERKAYLELNDWNVDEAIINIREDIAWEEEQKRQKAKLETNHHQPKEARIHVDVAIPVQKRGNGESPKEETRNELTKPLLHEYEMGRRY